MTEKLTDVQDVFLGRINQMCGKFGLNNIMAQLYAILYLSGKPMSLNDMVERLKISKGSASVNMRALERYGAARKVWVKGSRRDFYEAEADITMVILNRVKSMTRHRLSEIEEIINLSYASLNAVDFSSKEEKDDIKIFRQKLDELNSLHKKGQSLFNLLNSNVVSGLLSVKAKKNNGRKAAMAVK